MNALRTLLLFALCMSPLACRSNTADESVACTCGQPEADFEGCADQRCLSGERNPDNPDCVCGAMKIGK